MNCIRVSTAAFLIILLVVQTPLWALAPAAQAYTDERATEFAPAHDSVARKCDLLADSRFDPQKVGDGGAWPE